MKTAVKHLMLGSCLLALSALAAPAAGHAQTADPAVAPVPVATPPAPAAHPPSPPPDVKIPDLSAALPDGKKDPKGIDLTNGKVPDSVKDVIKRLNVKNEDVTLDDLNAAREAVAKLDALIDIEKRLVDLDKIRQEREESTKAALVAAIPATALTPPPMSMTSMQESRPMIVPQANIDVERIEGSNNRYVAVLKEGENTRVVHPGDRLPDNSVVLSVTTRGVELQRNNKVRLIEVKDVQSVFGNTP